MPMVVYVVNHHRNICKLAHLEIQTMNLTVDSCLKARRVVLLRQIVFHNNTTQLANTPGR